MGTGAVRICAIAAAAAASFGFGVTGAAASSFKTIYTFGTNGSETISAGSLAAKDGDLYGVIYGAGSNGTGSLAKLTTDGVLTTIYSFTHSETFNPAGVLPFLGSYYVSGFNFLATISAGGVQTRVLTPFKAAGGGFSQVSVDGSLFVGAANIGGMVSPNNPDGFGLIFSLNKTGVKGAYKSLYKFTGGADGAYPTSSPINVNGTLYGVTSRGGQNNAGVFYSLSPTGTETVLFSFDSDKGGATQPVYDGAGHFYGTEYVTNTPGVTGLLYSTDTAGNRTVVHTYTTDEGSPFTGLTYVNGTFYGGTTTLLYSVDASGTFTILHTFATAQQYAPVTMVAIGDSLYGASNRGGKSTVFKLTP